MNSKGENNMSGLMERTVDAEILASFQEEDEFLRNTMSDYSSYNNPERNASLRDEEKKSLDAYYWTEKLNTARAKHVKEDYKNPFTGFGNTTANQPETKPEPNFFEKVATWISDNPGTAILATLLVGGGAYLLARHLNGNNSKNKESNGSVSKSRKRKFKVAMEQDNDVPKKENVGYDLIPKEFAIGAATAAGGALLGTVLEDYSIAAAIPVAALGLTKKNIPIIAAAIGLALSKPLRKIFHHIFGNQPNAKEKMEKKGYIETMFGFVKPTQEASDS